METSRCRIIYFVENQGIRPRDFLQKTQLKKGILDKSHQNSETTIPIIAKILEEYPSLNPFWLLTGKGEMLLNNEHSLLSTDNQNIKSQLTNEPEEIIRYKELSETYKELINLHKEYKELKAKFDEVQSELTEFKKKSKHLDKPVSKNNAKAG